MHFGHPYSTPQSPSGVWAAVWGLLVMMARIRHGAGIYQATELRNLDKSDMCEHASVWVWFLCSFLHLWMLSLFIPTQFPLPLLFSRKSRSPQDSLAGWTAAQKHCGQVRSFMCNPSFSSHQKAVFVSYAVTFLWRNSFMFIIKGHFPMTASLIMIL